MKYQTNTRIAWFFCPISPKKTIFMVFLATEHHKTPGAKP